MMNNRVKTKRLAFAAILTAMSAVFLAGAVWLPSGRIACLALAGLPVYLLDLTLRRRYSLLSLAASSLLTLFFGGTATALAYFLFFGSYPIVKDFLEAKLYRRKGWIWVMKFVFFNLMAILLYLFAREVFLPGLDELLALWKLCAGLIGGNAIFYLYDRAFGRCGAALFFRLKKYTDQLL